MYIVSLSIMPSYSITSAPIIPIIKKLLQSYKLYKKHIVHCCLLVTVIIVFEISTGGIRLFKHPELVDPIESYGLPATILLYFLRSLCLLGLPQVCFSFLGLTIYNAFPDKVKLTGSPLLAPFICIRTVTKGDYPELVKNNVLRNINTCLDVGLENFMVEVVTDKAINLPENRRIRETVVGSTYKPKSGCMFKARALQYCLEEDVNLLSDTDWIVHLDEETLLTDNSVRGILNFVCDGSSQFGQGLITYANEQVVNWVTTLADTFRVTDDMGKLRFQFKMFNKPLFSWKGSYVVTQVSQNSFTLWI